MLIAESGASKISWCLVTKNQLYHFDTEGIRCGLTSATKINRILNQVSIYFDEHPFNELFFYGSGCLTEKRQVEMEAYLKFHFPMANQISVLSDLHAAARSTHGKNPGLTFIIGTGSVIFKWDGNDVVGVFGGKGFPGGDPVGGADLGYRLITYLQNDKASELRTDFEDEFGNLESLNRIISDNGFFANDYATFAPFIIKNKSVPIISDIINSALSDFFADMPENYETENISVIGSIGFYLQDEIRSKLNLKRASRIRFERQPITGLVEFHRLSPKL